MDQLLTSESTKPGGIDNPHSAREAPVTAKQIGRRKRLAWLRRLLPRLRVRDLFWIVLLSAVLMTWYRDRSALVDRLNLRSGNARQNWSVRQLLGPPNTPMAGDQVTAWASASQNAAVEWVIVEFPRSANAAKVEIVETYNPGAVRRICSVSAGGKETQLWKGMDPTPATAAMGRSVIALPPGTYTRRLKIYLNSAAVPGWNEIDAVGLHARNGTMQWASNAWASTAFGDNQRLPAWFWP